MNVSVVREKGRLQIAIDGKLYDPLSFKSFRPNPQNISEFYRAGNRLFCMLSSGVISALGVPYSLFGESWVGEGKYDFSPIDRQMEMFIANAPDAYFAPMFQIDTRPWYLEKRQGFPNSFTHLSQMAADREWRRAASDYLRAAIGYCEEKYGDRIFGYFLLGGTTTEWFSGRDYEESFPIKEEAFRRYCRDENAALPTLEELNRGGDVFLEADESKVRQARKFHAELVSETALYFAHEAQEVLQHRKLLGMYFGYLFELGGERIYNDGHLAYESVFLSPDVNMFSAPASYKYRLADDPSAFMLTQKTLDAHGKLFFHEFDHITHVAPESVSEPTSEGENHLLVQIPGAKRKCRNEAESLNLLYRDFLLCNANGAALWWFDMFDGWFRSEGMMNAIHRMIELTKNVLSECDRSSVSEVAVIAEGESMYRVRKSAKIATVCLSQMRRSFAEMGAPFDLYSVCDLPLCDPKRYKLIILLDCYDIPRERMDFLRGLQAGGSRLLWVYAPDYAHGGENRTENISRAVGMQVTASEISHGGVLFGGETTETEVAAPYFAIEDPNAEILARYCDGSAAVAVNREGNSFYAAVPFVSSAILREIAERCGIFLYSRCPKVYTYVNASTVGVYNATNEDAVIALPRDGSYRDLISDVVFVCENGKLRLPLREMRAYLLMREEKTK